MDSRKVVAGAKNQKRVAGRIKTRSKRAMRVVRRKMEKLQRIVPGGHKLNSNCLLLFHTADYILYLWRQLNDLRKALMCFKTNQQHTQLLS